MMQRGADIVSSQSFSIFADILSCLWDLFELIFLIIVDIWLLLMLILSKVSGVFFVKCGKTLAVSIIVHWFLK